MPIYEYQCKECGSHFEKRQSVSDEPLTKCETCGGTLEKKWSLSGFSFKGEGWYVTDYAGKKDGGKTEKKEEKSSGVESTAKPETASNTASDTSTAPKTDTSPKKT